MTSSLVAAREHARQLQFRHEDDGTLSVIHAGKTYNLSEKFGF